jgi:hypothetical protein
MSRRLFAREVSIIPAVTPKSKNRIGFVLILIGAAGVAIAWSNTSATRVVIHPVSDAECKEISAGATCPVVVSNQSPTFVNVQNLASTCSPKPTEVKLLWPYGQQMANARIVRVERNLKLRLYYRDADRQRVVEYTLPSEEKVK